MRFSLKTVFVVMTLAAILFWAVKPHKPPPDLVAFANRETMQRPASVNDVVTTAYGRSFNVWTENDRIIDVNGYLSINDAEYAPCKYVVRVPNRDNDDEVAQVIIVRVDDPRLGAKLDTLDGRKIYGWLDCTGSWHGSPVGAIRALDMVKVNKSTKVRSYPKSEPKPREKT
jgi:hypothetical protein